MKKKKDVTTDSVSKGNVKIMPIGDRVLIQEIEVAEGGKTASGIYIPDSVKEDHGSKHGKVLAVGPGKFDDGVIVPMTVKVGDEVLYQWGDTVKIGEEEYVMVSESNIIGIIK